MLQVYNTLQKDAHGKYYYDYNKAFTLLNHSNAVSQFYIGECYYYGRGVPKNLEKASEYFYKSAEQGYSKALTRMGRLIQDEEYIEADYSDQLKNIRVILISYEKAIERDDNDSNAKVKLALFRLFQLSHYYLPSSQQHIENQETAIHLLQEASLLRCAEAYFMLGQIAGVEHMTNFSVPYMQIKLYIRAAELGSMVVLKHICNFYYTSNKNLEEVVWWYWWAKRYDPLYNNDEIEDFIKKDELYTLVYDKMTEYAEKNYYHMVCDKEDPRLYDDVHALWFRKALRKYYKQKLLSIYVPFNEKIRISRVLFEKKTPKINKNIFYDYKTYIPVYVQATILSNNAIIMGNKELYRKLLNELIIPLNHIELHKNNKKLRRIPASAYESILNDLCLTQNSQE